MLPLNRDTIRRVVCGVDWGFVHPGVIEVFVLDGDDRMIRIWEVYQSGKTIDWWVERAREIKQAYGPVEAFVCDPSEPAYITAFQVAGLAAIPAFNSIPPGIQAVQQRLKVQGDGRPRLFFLRDQRFSRDEAMVEKKLPTCFEEEVDAYVWPTPKPSMRNTDEVPVKENDHAADAVRYCVCYVDSVGMNRYVPASPPGPVFEPKQWW